MECSAVAAEPGPLARPGAELVAMRSLPGAYSLAKPRRGDFSITLNWVKQPIGGRSGSRFSCAIVDKTFFHDLAISKGKQAADAPTLRRRDRRKSQTHSEKSVGNGKEDSLCR